MMGQPTWKECSRKMSVEVSRVQTAAALPKGMRSYAPAALGNSCNVSLALESSIAATSSPLGGMATAVPANALYLSKWLVFSRPNSHLGKCSNCSRQANLLPGSALHGQGFDARQKQGIAS